MVLGRLAAALLLATAAIAQTRSGLDVSTFDRSVRPQDDLFRYVNGTWLSAADIPPDRVTYGTTAELADKTEADVKAIVDDVIARRVRAGGSATQQLADLYLSATDEATIEHLGAAPLRPELARIDAIRTGSDMAAEAGRLSSIGAGGPFAGSTGSDPLRPGTPIVRIVPGGTLLPDGAYYTAGDPAMAAVRGKYEAYLRRIFEATGREAPADAARDVLALEAAIAQAQWDDSDAPDGRYTLHELTGAMPGFDWTAWARPQGLDHTPAVILARPVFFKTFAALVPRVPLRTWQNWLVARYVTAAAPYLSSTFDMARFDFFGVTVTGQVAPRARWKRGVSMLNSFLGDAIGRLYVERHFPSATRTRARRLVASIVDAYRVALGETRWMSPAARREAQARLAGMTASVGYPDEWRDYGTLVVKPDDLFGNWLRALAFESGDKLRRVRASSGGGLWLQPPQTVGAFYSAVTNEIVVPAGILQPPIFDVDAEDAANYGAAGALVAHEIAHAFADKAGDFDAGPLIAQLDALEPLPGLHVNGRTTAVESFGDLAGLSIALSAYRQSLKGRTSPVIDGLSGEQRFFLAWARMWRAKERPEYVRSTLQTSAHLPATLRANFAASNTDGFYGAFGVTSGDRLFRAPTSRVRVW